MCVASETARGGASFPQPAQRRPQTLGFPVGPMKATLGSLPQAHNDDLWAYEIKWDGYRTLAFVNAGRMRLQSSNGLDVTPKYPELTQLSTGLNAGSAILDGELVVLDQHGHPSFEMMQQHASDVVFYMFDVLQVDGHDTIELPYEQRRALLGGLIEPGSHWNVPAHHIGGGAELLAATAAMGLEGVMAKRLGSLYQPGKRSPNWFKIKNRRRVEVVIGGFTPGTGNRSSTFGALLVGLDGPQNALTFAGGVGTGFNHNTLDSLHRQLLSLRREQCPFQPAPPTAYSRDAIWVDPQLGATIEIAEFTNEGFVRHASFIALTERR